MKFFYLIIIFIGFVCLKDLPSTDDWDEEFLSRFLLLAVDDDDNVLKLYTMLNDCISSPKSYKSIDNMCQAIQHYKKKEGGTVKASSYLINNLKNYESCFFFDKKTYQKIKTEVEEKITQKIIEKLKKGKKKFTIQNSPNSFRSGWYLALGSYVVNIEYEKEIDVSNIKSYNFEFTVHFYGEDRWDFEEKDCLNIYDISCFLHNLVEEKLPHWAVGDGKEFTVSYDFYDTINVNLDFAINKEKSENFQYYNRINILLFLIFFIF